MSGKKIRRDYPSAVKGVDYARNPARPAKLRPPSASSSRVKRNNDRRNRAPSSFASLEEEFLWYARENGDLDVPYSITTEWDTGDQAFHQRAAVTYTYTDPDTLNSYRRTVSMDARQAGGPGNASPRVTYTPREQLVSGVLPEAEQYHSSAPVSASRPVPVDLVDTHVRPGVGPSPAPITLQPDWSRPAAPSYVPPPAQSASYQSGRGSFVPLPVTSFARGGSRRQPRRDWRSCRRVTSRAAFALLPAPAVSYISRVIGVAKFLAMSAKQQCSILRRFYF